MNATGKNYVERVVASATKMDRLIQDLVKYGRMSRQDLACENVSLETCVCEVVGAMAGTLAAKNATVQVERPFPQVWGNARTLRDVLAQLVDNMLLFAKAESAPCFHIRAESEESAVRLYLEENGATVLPEQAGQTFTPSEPANGNHSEVGLGIGMALVEKGMAKMGGTVNADFPPGRSSRFWIELGHAH